MANDKGQEYTDSVISELEKKIQKEYKQANDEVQQKVDDYFARFAKKDQKKQAQLKAGYITQEEYNEWRYGQVCVGERWKELKQNLAQDYVNTNQIARGMIEDRQADVYAMNHNFATYQVEHDSLMDTSYTLYNRRTVQNLIKDDPRLLPFPKTDSPTAKKLRDRMDLIWNRQKINSAITQGVLQGESIPQISKRLQKVTDMNHTAAVRNARTMMTSCENKGRQDAYDSLREKGIDLAEKWIATLDGRTRHSHRHLHGTYKDPKTGEYENGLRYPADPMGEPEEIYNCRCCEIAEVLGFKIDTPTTSPKLGDMSFDEWLNAKGNKESLWWHKDKKETTDTSLLPDVSGVMKGISKIADTSIENVLKGVNPDYKADEYDWETHANCAYCGVATELRFRGYDVNARHRQKDERVAWWHWRGDKLVNGKGSFTDCFEGLEFENAGATRSKNAIERTTKLMESYGDGARAIVYVQWSGTSDGHYFNAINTVDGVKFIDGQSNETDVAYYLEQSKPSWINLFRTDNKELTDFVHKVVKDGKADK